MKTLFYPRLAMNGIKKNKRLYLPYTVTCIAMVMMMYITTYLARSESIANTSRGVYAQWCLWLGIIVMSIFSLIFLFYSYSVLIKNRGKEFGIYNILGMNKRNIARILTLESAFTLIISLLGGLTSGILLSRLAELCMFRLLGIEPVGGLLVDPAAIAITAAVFAVITVILLLYSFVRIGRLSAIKLLHSEKEGEKPPRANFVFAIIGVLLLALAYYIAVTTPSGLEVISMFFIAVLLVIIGTYMLFVSGSVALCRLLMKNRKYYYKANHFVSVSGMTYRMKRNGAGLASICILSTMVLVMLSSTISLFSGIQTSTLVRSRDISVILKYDSNSESISRTLSDYCDTAFETAKAKNYNPVNPMSYDYLELGGYYSDNAIHLAPHSENGNNSSADIRDFYFITLDDYNKTTDMNETLSDGEILIATSDKTGSEISINDKKYKAKSVPMPKNISYGETIYSVFFVILPDNDALYDMFLLNKQVYGKNASWLNRYYGFDVDGNAADEQTLCEDISNTLAVKCRYSENILPSAEGRNENLDMLVATYGGLLFLGIFLGLVFVFATVLIIYYKQVSEGYEDRERYATMRSVGMTEKEIKKSINSQVLTVFFAPLIFAGIHLSFAFPIILKAVKMLGFADSTLLLVANLICFAVFALFYIFAYKITSGIYLKIIERK
ncbi:MAG: ABC transporter permease [Ruminiclostridium sp.]|nr:ABC transporter permease [Ruminiclostridium sp.]